MYRAQIERTEAMKAAIVRAAGEMPTYGDFPEPGARDGEAIVTVVAAAISQVVKSRAAGTHYSATNAFPFVPGIDGAGRLADGRRVYFAMPRAPFGSMAERVPVPSALCIPLPDDLDDVTAAAIANPGMSSWAAYRLRARLKPGDRVLVNGATGTAGRLAVQIARHLGAGKVIAAGRNIEVLQEVAALGADGTVPLDGEGEATEGRFRDVFEAGIDVVIDYLWGPVAERTLVAAAKAAPDAVPIRYVQVGSAAGQEIALPGAVLRAKPIELMGSGLGSVPVDRLVTEIREMMEAVVPAGLRIATRPVPLSAVGEAWAKDDSRQRTVFTMG
jgi:NADPH:quinone reductase-like Zn-dependent oxidoreductase